MTVLAQKLQSDESNIDQRIGVLLVHGIGEQGAFEHLEAEVRHIVRGLGVVTADGGVEVQVRAAPDIAPGATRRPWSAAGRPPITAIAHDGAKRVAIDFHEVWWADLDQADSLGTSIRFWIWGLGQWNARRYDRSFQADQRDRCLPCFPEESEPPEKLRWLKARARFRLFLVAVFFFLVVISLSAAKLVLKMFKDRVSPTILVSYLGDVKLYQQRGRAGEGDLQDLGAPPRAAIMRRMVTAMVDMALHRYDRWYIMAHSLGSVVAWDGLNQSDRELAALATDAQRQRFRAQFPGATVPMDRAWLFGRLQGLCTYGAPLDKFAFLWPRIVSLNPEVEVFPSRFEWINVYDPTDPVGAKLDAYARFKEGVGGPKTEVPERLQPRNFAYRASPLLLISHIRYLDFRPKQRGEGQFAERIGAWILRGQPFAIPDAAGGWLRSDAEIGRRDLLRRVQWCAASYLMLLLTTWLLLPSVVSLVSWMAAPADGNAMAWWGVLLTTLQEPLTWFAHDRHDTIVGTLVIRPAKLALLAATCVILAGMLLRRLEDRSFQTRRQEVEPDPSAGTPAA